VAHKIVSGGNFADFPAVVQILPNLLGVFCGGNSKAWGFLGRTDEFLAGAAV